MAELERKQFRKGEVIFREGDWEMWMYDILQGKVGVYTDYGTERENRIAVLGVHDFFGEMGLVDAMPRSATAVAELDTTAVQISGEALGAWFRESPEKVVAVMRHLSSRTRELTEDYREVCGTIAELRQEKGTKHSDGLRAKVRRFADFWRKNGGKQE